MKEYVCKNCGYRGENLFAGRGYIICNCCGTKYADDDGALSVRAEFSAMEKKALDNAHILLYDAILAYGVNSAYYFSEINTRSDGVLQRSPADPIAHLCKDIYRYIVGGDLSLYDDIISRAGICAEDKNNLRLVIVLLRKASRRNFDKLERELCDRAAKLGIELPGIDYSQKEAVRDGLPSGEVIIADNRARFGGNGGISRAVYASGVTSVPASAFDNCTNLAEAEFCEGILIIGGSAFAHTGITRIKIPASVREIGEYCFYNTELKRAEFADPEGWYLQSAGGEDTPVSADKLALPIMAAKLLSKTYAGRKFIKRT